jgi:hypothetical protein
MWFPSALAVFSSEFARARRAQRQQQSGRCRPRLEVLEGRSVPSALTVTSNLLATKHVTPLSSGQGTGKVYILTAQPIKQTPGALDLRPSMTVTAINGADNGILWPALVEKAYAQSMNVTATLGADTVRFFNN